MAIWVGLAGLIAGSWIVVLTVRLQAVSEEAKAGPASLPYAVGELVRRDGALAMKIHGSPGATVVLIIDGEPVRFLDLDGKGRARVDDLVIDEGARIEIATLAEEPDVVAPLPTTTATATATMTRTAATTPAATDTARPGPIATATRTPMEAPILVPTAAPSEAEHRIASRAGPRPGLSPPVLHLVTDAGPRIAITFDGNASSNGTAGLLELLHDQELEITLFVTGGFIERYPDLVRRAVLAGHEVGNHSYSHPRLTTYARNKRHDLLPGVTKSWFQGQLRRTEEAFRKATGRPMAPLWRAPFGEENAVLRGWALELGYLHVRWSSLEGASLDSLDWISDEHSRLYRDSQRMVDRLLQFPRLEGGIVLMHLATERSEPPWSDLPRFVEELRRRDVKPVKVSTLLGESGTWRPWLERAHRRHREEFPE